MGKSRKVLVGEKNEIVNKLIAPLQEERDKCEAGYIQQMEQVLRKHTPSRVLEIERKFPDHIRTMGYTSIYTGFRNEFVLSVVLKCPIFDGYQKVIKDSKEISDLARECKKKREEYNEKIAKMRHKLHCVLGPITSPKKLREEFPEAYAIWEGLGSVDGDPKTLDLLRERANEIKKEVRELKELLGLKY